MKKLMTYSLLVGASLSSLSAQEVVEASQESVTPQEEVTAEQTSAGFSQTITDGNFTATIQELNKKLSIVIDLPGLDISKVAFQIIPEQGHNFLVGFEEQQPKDIIASETMTTVVVTEGSLTADQTNAEVVSAPAQKEEQVISATPTVSENQANETSTETLAPAQIAQATLHDDQASAQEEKATGFVLRLPQNVDLGSMKIEKLAHAISITLNITMSEEELAAHEVTAEQLVYSAVAEAAQEEVSEEPTMKEENSTVATSSSENSSDTTEQSSTANVTVETPQTSESGD